MKAKPLLTILLLLLAMQATAQGWKVYKADGTVVDFPYTEVDSIVANAYDFEVCYSHIS